MGKVAYVVIFILINFLGIVTASANDDSEIKITGHVMENTTPIKGASVIIAGTTRGAITETDGSFVLAVNREQPTKLLISSIGYRDTVINFNPLQYTADKGFEIQLSTVTNELSKVEVVSARRKQGSIDAVYVAQKNGSAISDGISSDIIKKSPDKNTADVLRRISGTTVQDNKFVIIRGLNERYNTALLNNSVLPSTEADKKAFSFNIIPSAAVENLVIYKTPTPDLPGDFAGGAVKVVTKDFPTTNLHEVSLSLSYNSLTTGKNFYRSYPKGSLDALGFFDDSRQIPGPYYRHRVNFINQTDEFKLGVTKMFPNTYGYFPAIKSLPAISFSYTAGKTSFLKNENKFGYIYYIGYGNGRNTSEKQRLDYTLTGSPWQEQYDYKTNVYDQKNNLSALLNLTYSFGSNKISLKNLFNNELTNITGIRQGKNFENAAATDVSLIKSVNSEAVGSGIVNSVLEGTHNLKNSWDIDWNMSFGYTYKNQPDQRILAFRTQVNNSNNYFLGLTNENSPEVNATGRVYSFLNEDIYGLSANVAKNFTWLGQTQTLKFGTMNYYRNRHVDVDALGYATLNSLGIKINETPQTTYTNIFSPDNIDAYRITVANLPLSSTSYKGNVLLNAGYAMLNNKFSSKLKLTWGVRIEHYKQLLEAEGKGRKDYNNTDVLPSALLTYALNSKTNLRLAGSQSVNRPEFREIADYRSYDYDNDVSRIGNPTLKRSKNTNADLRYEWFPSNNEIVSASLFYKYFNKPIEQTNLGNNTLSYTNANHSSVYGVEIEVRKRLSFIEGNFFRHVIFYVNAAYQKGSIQIDTIQLNSPMQGQSPYLVNAGLSYTSPDNNFDVNILYNRIGPRLLFRSPSTAALNIFEKDRDVLDVQLTQKFLHKKLEAKLTVSDILSQPFKWYYKQNVNSSNINYNSSKDVIIASNKFGATASLSLRYNF